MKKQKRIILILVVTSIAAILTGGFSYITSVQRSLWNKSVTDILEVTAQGSHALDTYIEKDMEMLHLLSAQLSSQDPVHSQAIIDLVNLTDESESAYRCINLDTGIMYDDTPEAEKALEPEQLDRLRSLEDQNIFEPYLDSRTGVWIFGYYQRFQWPDKSQGFVQKIQPLSETAERFSLSFYNQTGFSYVVNPRGDILMRSQHPNSNRTFKNLFDIIDLQGNNPESIQSFRSSLESGKRGVARFYYQKEDYVFCYVPMNQAPGWYVVSIVPNHVIMEQADIIVQDSQVFIALISVSIVVMAAFFLVYRSTSHRILLAEEKARKAAESSNLAKSRFLSNMSHDIRTPMNAILGMTRLASNHADEPEKVRQYLKNIELSGNLLVGLINDILDMSKIESGKMLLNNDTASLETLLTNLVRIIQPMAAGKNQTLNFCLHGIVHENLCFDSLRLSQALMNLLSNAVKFTPQGGSISMDVTESPSLQKDCVHFTFQVADTGIGMKPEFLEHIFDSFTQEQNNRINQVEGSGLGMAITKMIVDMMEGTINIESAPGRGSTFTVELDLILPHDISPEELHLPSLSVLVADDDPETCRSAKEFLGEMGITADVTTSGKEAVEKAASAHKEGRDYHLILLDWKMPDLNGMDAALAIRRETGYEIPLIIVSAYDWSGIETQAVQAGVNGFIQKPFFKSTLYHCIRQYVFNEESSERKGGHLTDLSGRRILLAEDNKLNQEIAGELLSSLGAQVEVVNNGEACTQRFEESPEGYFDLILMDIQMPIMNGYQAAKYIRNLKRRDATLIPIFAMTADAFAEDIKNAAAAGMNCHLAKPLDIPGMMREIEKHLKVQEGPEE